MPIAGLSLLSPAWLLVSATAAIPVAAAGWLAWRHGKAAHALGLRSASPWAYAPSAAAAAAACLVLGVAATQPILTTTTDRTGRTESELLFVVDVSRSMSASTAAVRPTRLERARAIVAELREAAPDVPAGISGLTDRMLPYVFPTLDANVFAETLADSVQIDAPPPQDVSLVATSFEPLTTVGRNGFFKPGVDTRTCVLVTDGETRSTEQGVSAPSGGCSLVVVRVGGPGDRIFTRDGKVNAAYRPERSAAEAMARLAESMGGSVFAEDDLAGARDAIRQAAERGPSRTIGTSPTTRELAPYLAGLALAIVLVLVLSGLVPEVRRRLHTQGVRQYDFGPDARARRAG